jgi:uncharacterized protein
MYAIPELRSTESSIRISPERDVPVTPRVKRIIDTAAFRRLSSISQLGLVAYVYPGATHTRFEHSLGVYFNAIQFVTQLETNALFRSAINEEDVCCFLLAALLHDIGHWPFCHAIEDLGLPNVPRHEILASRLVLQGELAERVGNDWQLDPKRIIDLLNPDKSAQNTQASSILSSMLSGPFDIDKMDYLERDSVHAGVPYGRNFDRHRLIRSLCINPEKNAIALSEKGKTAIEMMIFARYIMFSEVYWHHAVRSATAMLQNVVWECAKANPSLSFADQWLESDDAQMKQSILQMSRHQPWEGCAQGLFGSHRCLYKRLIEFDSQNEPHWHQKLSSLSAPDLRETAGKLSEEISKRICVACCPFDLLIDAPPASLDVQFRMEVLLRNGRFRPLGDISPMVQALATQQFDETVKRVRIFASPSLATKIRESKLSVVDYLANVL